MKFFLMLLLAAATALGADKAEAPVRVTEKIQDISPDGKYALRIMYDGEPTRQVAGKDGILSETIQSISIVSLPKKGVVRDLTKAVFEGGTHFEEITFLWSTDSKWCAFYFTYPRVGYTLVFHLLGAKFSPAHTPYELENFSPKRWVKPGILEVSSEDSPASIATFDGKGTVKFRKKK
jgi:hypothetical protein